MRARFRALPGGWQAAIAFVLLVAGLNVFALVANRVAPEPAGPPYSSYATSREGAAGLAELLERDGRRVEKLRGSLTDAELDPDATVFLLGADRLSSDEAVVLADFLAEGGRLVAGGPSPYWLGGVTGGVHDWADAGSESLRPIVPAPEVRSVGTVSANGVGTWLPAAEGLPLLGGATGPTLLAQQVGGGRALLLADVSPIQNESLDEADNAELALGLAGEGRRKVIFVEGVHGYGETRGLGALPTDWKWALAGLGLAGVVFMWAIGRRFGPPEDDRRPLPPPRRRYVDAQALTLARTHQPAEAAAPVLRAARERLARRAALGPEAAEAQLRTAARQFGLDEAETEAVLGRNPDVLAAGRALARLS